MGHVAKIILYVDKSLYYRLLNKGRFYNNSKIDTLISRRLSVENKAKFSKLKIVNTVNNRGVGVLSFQLREFRFVPSRKLL